MTTNNRAKINLLLFCTLIKDKRMIILYSLWPMLITAWAKKTGIFIKGGLTIMTIDLDSLKMNPTTIKNPTLHTIIAISTFFITLGRGKQCYLLNLSVIKKAIFGLSCF